MPAASDIVSHPVWVRGLKLIALRVYLTLLKSHPVWVRGLKHHLLTMLLRLSLSHPVWVRGLKPPISKGEPEITCVAPRVGAWIETNFSVMGDNNNNVAPRVGAWIETKNFCFA